MSAESQFVYIFPGTGTQEIELPASASAPQKPWPDYVQFDDRGGKLIAKINTDSSKLLAVAWERAADAITCWTPACPAQDLEDIWPDWCRAVLHIAIRPDAARLEELVWDILGENASARASVVRELFHRIKSQAGPSVFERPELARLFVWDKRFSRDASPGLLQARWLHWDIGRDATFSVHVSHPATVPVTGTHELPVGRAGDLALCRQLANSLYPPHPDRERPGRVAVAIRDNPISVLRPP